MSSELEASVAEKLGFRIEHNTSGVAITPITRRATLLLPSDVIAALHSSLLAAEERVRTLERERDEYASTAQTAQQSLLDASAAYEIAEQLNRELAESLKESAIIVHRGRFHQWKDLEMCTERECKAVRALLTRVKGEKL